jgi:hypothetical protein
MHSVSKHQDGSLSPHRCHITITTSSPTQNIINIIPAKCEEIQSLGVAPTNHGDIYSPYQQECILPPLPSSSSLLRLLIWLLVFPTLHSTFLFPRRLLRLRLVFRLRLLRLVFLIFRLRLVFRLRLALRVPPPGPPPTPFASSHLSRKNKSYRHEPYRYDLRPRR